MSVTICDIAKACNVSTATVSRILNCTPNVSFMPDTRKKVLETAQEMGYKTSKLSRTLTAGKTNLIALTGITMLPYALGGCILRHVHDRVNEHDFALTMLDHKVGLNIPSVDGILVWNNPEWLKTNIDSFDNNSIQTVAFGCEYNLWQRDTDIVLFTSTTAIMNLLNKWIDSGRTNIALLYGGDISILEKIQDSRLVAYRNVMKSNNLDCTYICYPGIGDRHYMTNHILEALRDRKIPDAIFCVNDVEAICTMKALEILGVKVPEQTAIAGFDGIEETEYTKVALTTIKLPYEQGSRLAVDFLCNRIVHPGYPRQTVTLEAELIERESMGC